MPRDYDVLNLFSLVRSKKYKSNVSLCKKIMFWISSMLSNSGDSQFSECEFQCLDLNGLSGTYCDISCCPADYQALESVSVGKKASINRISHPSRWTTWSTYSIFSRESCDHDHKAVRLLSYESNGHKLIRGWMGQVSEDNSPSQLFLWNHR